MHVTFNPMLTLLTPFPHKSWDLSAVKAKFTDIRRVGDKGIWFGLRKSSEVKGNAFPFISLMFQSKSLPDHNS